MLETPDELEPSNVIAFSNPFLRHRARVRSMRMLVADDHEANRMVLQRLLEKAGHRVMCVNGAEQVLDAMADEDFDAVIVDLHMPGMSGLDMLKQLRVMQASGMRYTPVVVLSADVTPEAIRACEQAGARAFLAKPVVAAKLLDTVLSLRSAPVHWRRRLRSCRHRPVSKACSTPACWTNLPRWAWGKNSNVSSFGNVWMMHTIVSVRSSAMAAARIGSSYAKAPTHCVALPAIWGWPSWPAVAAS